MRPSSPRMLLVLPIIPACKQKPNEETAPATTSAATADKTAAGKARVGLVLGLGGREDQSFNDSALRGLEG